MGFEDDTLCAKVLLKDFVPYFVKIHDFWLYSTPKPITFEIVCDTDCSETKMTITGVGKLKLHSGCGVFNKERKIMPQTIFNTQPESVLHVNHAFDNVSLSLPTMRKLKAINLSEVFGQLTYHDTEEVQ